MDMQRVIQAFERNRYDVRVFHTGEEAADYLDMVIDGKTVGFGDSETLISLGLYSRLRTHNRVLIRNIRKKERILRKQPGNVC